MHQMSRPQPLADLIADSSFYLPGLRLTHILHVVSLASGDAAAQVDSFLKAKDARVGDSLSVRCRHLIEQRIVLDDIGERRAQALREQLLQLDGVLRIRLEHRFVRADDTEDEAPPQASLDCTAQ